MHFSQAHSELENECKGNGYQNITLTKWTGQASREFLSLLEDTNSYPNSAKHSRVENNMQRGMEQNFTRNMLFIS